MCPLALSTANPGQTSASSPAGSWGKLGCRGERGAPSCSGTKFLPSLVSTMVSSRPTGALGQGWGTGWASLAALLPAFQQSIGTGDTMGNPSVLSLWLQQQCRCTDAGDIHCPGPITQSQAGLPRHHPAH